MANEIDQEIGELLRALLRKQDLAQGLLTTPTSRRNRQRTQCDGKEVFQSFQLAQRAAFRQQQRHKMAFQVYKCAYCFNYHVGSTRAKAAII